MSADSSRVLETGKDHDGPHHEPVTVSQPIEPNPRRRSQDSQPDEKYKFDDSSKLLFSMYSKAAEEQDNEMVKRWRKDASEILIFTGLFSAAVAQLLAVSVQSLTPSSQQSQDISAFHLGNIYELLADPNATRTSIRSPVAPPHPFSPPRYAIWVNSLWFLSLVISLTCGLLASSAQQWARRYVRVTQPVGCGPEKRARMRALFANGVDILPNAWVVEGLPILLHLSVFIFFAGLSIFLFNTNHEVFGSVFWWIGLFSFVYASITLMPFVRYYSPYYSPLSLLAWFLYSGISHFFITVRFFMSSDRLVDFETWQRLRDLRSRYRGWFTGGVEKAAEDMVSDRPSEFDVHILSWIIGAFVDDNRIEELFGAIPGFFNSKLVKDLKSHLPNDLLKRFWKASNGFFARTLLSNSDIESKSRRLNIGMAAMSVISAPGPGGLPILNNILNNILSEPWDQMPQNVEMGHIMAGWRSSENKVIAQYAQSIATRILASERERNDRWYALATDVLGLPIDNLQAYIAHSDDSLSLAILISVASQHIHSDFYDWGLLSTLYGLDILNTPPELQHAFCKLWNDCVKEAKKEAKKIQDAFPLGILRLTRFLYSRLHHQDNYDGSRLFSRSTPDFDYTLYQPDSYPSCENHEHLSDWTIFDSPDASLHQSTHDNSDAPRPAEQLSIIIGSSSSDIKKSSLASPDIPLALHVHTNPYSLDSNQQQIVVAAPDIGQTLSTTPTSSPAPASTASILNQPMGSYVAGLASTFTPPLPASSAIRTSPSHTPRTPLYGTTIMEMRESSPTSPAISSALPVHTNRYSLDGHKQQDVPAPWTVPDIGQTLSIAPTSSPAPASTAPILNQALGSYRLSLPASPANATSPSHTTLRLSNPELLALLSGTPPSSPRVGATLPRLRARGLINQGNMYFTNAVLQLLVHCPPFRNLFSDVSRLTGQTGQRGQREDQQTSGGTTPLVDATVRLINEFAYKKEDDVTEPFTPMYVYDAMKEKRQFKSILGGQQRNAEGYLCAYLDVVDEELLALLTSISTHDPAFTALRTEGREGSQSDEGQTGVGKRGDYMSPISRIFDGKFRMTSQDDTVKVESWRTLQLDILPDSVYNVQDALALISQPKSEQVEPSDPGEASQQVTVLIEALPPVLIIHLKRFHDDAAAGGVVKNHKPVQFSPELEIPPDIMVPTVGRPTMPARYTLNGVLYHHGTPASGGRYTVDVLHSNTHESSGEAWVRIDDDSVSTVGHEEVFGRHDNERTDDRCAYLLFYRRTASTDLTT